MQSTPRRDTKGELKLRSALHRLGLRFRVDAKPWPTKRHKTDILFRRARVLVYFDGCFWHGCPTHCTMPLHNADWWRAKIERNKGRDRELQIQAESDGWVVCRVWEHDDLAATALELAVLVRERMPAGTPDL
jgi:DNA mismatch endonuclease (patch repair protein)